jgi:hypothetical protein
VKNKQGTLLLAVILAAPAFAFADSVPCHSKGGNKYVSLSDGFTGQQELQDGSARCNFLFSSPKENELQTTSISVLSTGISSDSRPVTVVDFGGNKGTSFGRDKGKGRGKEHGGDGEGNGAGAGVGSGGTSPLVSVAEPGLQTLLLFGLGGLGFVFYRRKTLTNAI